MVSYKRRLLVEGNDDGHVMRNLLRHHHVPGVLVGRDTDLTQDEIAIEIKGGKDALIASLPLLLDRGELEQLAIIVDADLDVMACWQSVCHVLSQKGTVSLPSVPEPQGTVVTLQQNLHEVIVGIWIMPNNGLPGALEDFIAFLVPAGDALWERARQCVNEIPAAGRRFPPERQSKAEIHTWLAWQEEPGKPLGQAVTARYLDTQAPHAQQLVAWLRRVFIV
ncbi:MAG: DUF3226 domain-containing protein [Chloroflexota bacterium]